jgi:GTP-binding protein Era
MTKKSGFVSIIGKPNSGKSTLLNAIFGESLAIVTPKPQTTRNKVFGIYTRDNIQIVFVDTPGILKPKYKLQVFMKKELESSFVESDVIALVYDVSKYDSAELKELYKNYESEFRAKKSFLLLNKIDLLTKEELLDKISDISVKNNFDEIIPVSAKKKFNVDEFMHTVEKHIPENEFYFDKDVIAAQPEKFFVSEIIREYALRLYSDEIPFSVFIEIDEFKEREKGKDFIRANILVEKESQKGIVIGSGGMMLKKLGELSRKEIEDFLGREVFLELFVKVKKNWKNDESFLKKNFTKQSAITD